ncbi:MAG: CocE/NonD family hydrolase C-terminal non-catalytic domain-containing protein [Baekduiaceae bacterium]
MTPLRGAVARACIVIAMCAATAPASAAEPTPAPFGLPCQPKAGVRFCEMTSLQQRVPSFDGVPIDLNVTLPATGDGPFPTVAMLHGLTGDKSFVEVDDPDDPAEVTSVTADYNNISYARRGYAVITITSRGFGASCGTPRSRRPYPACRRGWLHMGDRRWEARDAQTLLGRLVDEGIADPARLGVAGISYGGGQAMQLAFLKDRIALPDGTYAPWRSPAGTPLAIGAVYAKMGWSNLATALLPNGRYDGAGTTTFDEGFTPPGVMKLSYSIAATALTAYGGHVPGLGGDASADVLGWFTRLATGEPYRGVKWERLRGTMIHKSIYGIPGVPAPLLLESAFNDDMLDPRQSLEAYHQARAQGAPEVALQIGESGHPRANNAIPQARALSRRGADFLDALLQGRGTPPPSGSVYLSRFACPKDAPVPEPITAPSWDAVGSGSITFSGGSAERPVVLRSSPLDLYAASVDDPLVPLGGGVIRQITSKLLRSPQELAKALQGNAADLAGDAADLTKPCKLTSAARSSAATWTGPAAAQPFTVAGTARVALDLRTIGRYGMVSTRLWDLHPDGRRRLLARGVRRLTPNEGGRVVVPFGPYAYRFEAGHRPQVEVLAADSPMYKPSREPFTLAITGAEVTVPTVEPQPTTRP